MAIALSDVDLNLKLKSLVSEEKRLLKEILEFIAEVDRRKLFLPMGYPNLFEYLTREIGCSAGCAQRRIDSARLLIKIPELGVMIEKGSVNLTQVTQMQKNIRQSEKISGQKITVEAKKEILFFLENKNYQETELLLSKKFDLPIVEVEKKRIQKDESVRIEMTLTKNQMAILEEARALLSNTLGMGSVSNVLVHLASKFVNEKRGKNKNINKEVAKLSTAAAAVKSVLKDKVTQPFVKIAPNSDDTQPAFDKAIPLKIKTFILNRDQSCKFKDQKSGRICGSKFHLQVDHIRPRNKFGSNSPSNLQVLCVNHNLWKG